MACVDCSETALRLIRIADASEAADVIDDLVAKALRQAPSGPDSCVALIDLVIAGIDQGERQSRIDGEDIQALKNVAAYLRTLSH